MTAQSRLKVVLLVLSVISISRAGGNGTFSMPDSILLFHDFESGLKLVSLNHSETLQLPFGNFKRPVASPSLGQGGSLVSWGFPVAADPGKKWKVRCAVGAYSAPDKNWRTFGDFSQIHATALSSDGSKVAFIADETDSESRSLFVLSVGDGQITKLLKITAVSVGWSPDGKRLVIGTPGGDISPRLELLDIDSKNMHVLVEGASPAWSPSGDWIAFLDHSNERVRVIRPDGTGERLLKDVGKHFLGYRTFGGQPVWSPDGRKLLLNEYKGDYDSSDVVLLDVGSDRMTRLSTNADEIVGWTIQKN